MGYDLEEQDNSGTDSETEWGPEDGDVVMGDAPA